jgi:hypothetical protein
MVFLQFVVHGQFVGLVERRRHDWLTGDTPVLHTSFLPRS